MKNTQKQAEIAKVRVSMTFTVAGCDTILNALYDLSENLEIGGFGVLAGDLIAQNDIICNEIDKNLAENAEIKAIEERIK